MKLNLDKTQGVMPIHLGGAAACAVLLAIGWFVGLAPLMSENELASSSTEQAREAQEDAQHESQKLERLTARLKQVQRELDAQPVSLQTPAQINPLLAQLSAWADAHTLSLTRTNAGQPVALAYYDYVPITLAGEGTYSDLLGFFSKLHTGRGDLGVVVFNAARQPTGGGITFEIELAWYVSNESAGTREATAAAPSN